MQQTPIRMQGSAFFYQKPILILKAPGVFGCNVPDYTRLLLTEGPVVFLREGRRKGKILLPRIRQPPWGGDSLQHASVP